MTVNAVKVMLGVAKEFRIHDKWTGQPFEAIKTLPTTNKGDAGERFVERYAKALGMETQKKKSRPGDTDLKILKKAFEVKMATEDISGSFQFNHIRLDFKYDFLLCVGVSPNAIRFGIWTKAQVATDKAGHLVRMGKGHNADWKLTKRGNELMNIKHFKRVISRMAAKRGS